jgi:hypothetical protein
VNVRNTEIIKRYASHPLKGEISSALAAAELFADKASGIRADPNLSQEGRTNAVKSQLKAALRAVRDAGAAPVAEMRSRLDGIQASIKTPAIDKSDVAAALARQELRSAIRSMSLADKASLLVSDEGDPRWVDAVLEQPSVLSGVPQELYEKAKLKRFETLFKTKIAEGEDLDREIEEATAALTIARQDLAVSAGLPEHEFERLATEIFSTKDRPWLKRTVVNGAELTVVVRPGESHYPTATPSEIATGRYYADHGAWLADRAA